MNKKRILLSVPVRQRKNIFELYLKALNNLIIPNNFEITKYFYLHNSPELKTCLQKNQYEEITTSEEYKIDENTHYWNNLNLRIVAEIKNKIILKAIKEEFDYVFMVDSDLILHSKTLEGLINANKDIISNIFWTKWSKNDIESLPNCWDFDHYSFLPETLKQLKKPGIYKTGMTGASILIKTDVFKNKVNYNPIKNLSFWGEDRSFCIRAICAGYQIWVDTNYPSKHLYRESDVEEYLKNE
jgi:hypothetical protein